MSTDSAYIQSLIDAAPDGRVPPFYQAGRPIVVVPYGVYEIDTPIKIDRRLDVSFSGAVLKCADGVDGIELVSGSWGARARDVCVFGAHADAVRHGAIGVRVAAYGAELADVLVRFCGTGIRVESLNSAANANGWQWSQVQVHDCDTGVHLKGGDTNGGTSMGLVINVCRRGLVDESFLGNTFVGTMFHTVKEYAYECTVGANYSTFPGSYVEIDCGSALPGGFKDTLKDVPNCTWLGGSGAQLAKIGTRVGLASSRIRFGDVLPGGGSLKVTIPNAVAESVFDAQRLDPAGALIDGVRARFSSLLKRFGFEAYKPNVAGQPPTGDGLTVPLGFTMAGHASGFAKARVNAVHFSQGSTAGQDPNTRPVGDPVPVRRVPTLPAATFIGDVIEIVDLAQKTRRSYACEQIGTNNDGSPLLGWSLLS